MRLLQDSISTTRAFVAMSVATLLSVFLLTACSAEEATPVPDAHSGSAQRDSAYLSLAIRLNNGESSDGDNATTATDGMNTRAAASNVGAAQDGDTYAGDNGDRKITTLRVALYNADGQIVSVFSVWANGTVAGNFNHSPIVLKAQKIEVGRYRVFVVANPSPAMQAATAPNKTLQDLERVVSEESVNTLVNGGGVMMCATHFGYTDYHNFKGKAAEAEKIGVPVPMQLERTVAKVFVAPQAGDNITAPNAAGGHAQMVDFSMDVVNQRMYWMRHRTLVLTGNGTATAAAPTAQETDYTPFTLRYAEDPNMTALSGTDLTQQLAIAAPARNTTSQGGWSDSRGLYVMENTMQAGAQTSRQTTQAVICLRYVPKQLPQLANAADRTWANYKGALLTLEQLRNKLNAAKQANSSDASLEMPSGFKADAAQINREYPNITAATASFYKHNLKFYQNGQNFYTYPIRHYNDQQQPMLQGYGRYGVVRNHLYRLHVTRVSGPGDPVPTIPDDGPNDVAPTFLAVNLIVAPWVTIAQNKLVLE